MTSKLLRLLLVVFVASSLVDGLSRQRRMCGMRLSQKIIEICTSVSDLGDTKAFSSFSTIVSACCHNPCSEEDIVDFCLSQQVPRSESAFFD